MSKYNHLDSLFDTSKRIHIAIANCFIGNPYNTPLKTDKKKTYRLLQKMINANIKQVSHTIKS